MGVVALCLLVGGLLASLASGQTLGESFRGEIRSCETACEKSYPGQGEDQVRLFSFCRNGCRLLNVIDVLDGFSNLNDTKVACFKCCEDAYALDKSVEACKFGCENQVTAAEKRRQQIEEYCYRQQLDSLSPTLYISSIFSNMIENSNDRIIRSYYTQTINGGLVVVAESSSLVSDSGESYEDNSYNFMEVRGMIIGPVVNVPSMNNKPSAVIANEPKENNLNLALMSDRIFQGAGISRILVACLVVLLVLTIIWIWTSVPSAVSKQDRKLLLEKQNLKYLQCFDDSGELQVFVAPSSDDIKSGPPQCAASASSFKSMELIDVNSPFPLKFKVETV